MSKKQQQSADQIERAETSRILREKRSLRSKVLLVLILGMAVFYAFDKLYFDNALYFLIGGIDSLTDPENPWLPGFKAGIGTFLGAGFLFATLGACYMAWQER